MFNRLRNSAKHGRLHVISKDIIGMAKYGIGAPRYAEQLLVDPRSIQYVVINCPYGRKFTGHVAGGDWDESILPLDEYPKYRVCVERFVRGKSWEDAGAYELMAQLVQDKPGADGCFNLQDIKARYKAVDELYETVKYSGMLKPRSEVDSGTFRELGGVYVHIDRAGKALFGGGGTHRFAVARLLELSVIPAQIGTVHLEALPLWKRKKGSVWT